MQSDLPHTLYMTDTKKSAEAEFKYNEKDPAIAAQEEANRRAMERRGKQKEGYTINQIFNQ